MPRIEAATVAEHHAMRRSQVVDAAVEVLRESGAAALTPAAVAAKAGLARSSLYQYYPSTGELLAAAVETMLRRGVEHLRSAVDAAGSLPAERIAAYVVAAVDGARTGHAPFPDLTGVEMPQQCRVAVRTLHDALTAPLREALDAVEAGTDAPFSATLQLLVLGAINGATSAIDHGAPPAETTRATVDFVLRGLGLGSAVR